MTPKQQGTTNQNSQSKGMVHGVAAPGLRCQNDTSGWSGDAGTGKWKAARAQFDICRAIVIGLARFCTDMTASVRILRIIYRTELSMQTVPV
jgi:hypothetical protein